MGATRLSVAAAIVVLGAQAFAAGAQACSCAPLAPEQAMRRADAVIVGRLIEVVPRDEYRSEFRYEIVRAYKGGAALRTGRVISVLSASDGSACGLPTRLEKHYGLFLVRREDGWRGGSCGELSPRRLAATVRAADGDEPSSASSGAGCTS